MDDDDQDPVVEENDRYWPSLKFLILYVILAVLGGWVLALLNLWKVEGTLVNCLFLLPFLAWLLPSCRRRGGSFRGGCLLFLGIIIFWVYFERPPEQIERLVVPRLATNAPITCGGLQLGAKRTEVERLTGRGERAFCPVEGYRAFHYAHHDITYRSDLAVLISGDSVVQNGHPLFKVGQSKTILSSLAPDEGPMMRFACNGEILDCQSCDGRLSKIRLMASDLPAGVADPTAVALSLDGVCLEMGRAEVKRIKGAAISLDSFGGLHVESYPGPTSVFYGDDGSVRAILGGRLGGPTLFRQRGNYCKDREQLEIGHQSVVLYGQGGKLVEVGLAFPAQVISTDGYWARIHHR